MEDAFAAIGMAVVEAQAFELVMAPMYVLFKAPSVPGYVERNTSIPETALKQPLTQLVNELDAKGQIDAHLHDRLRVYADKRHRLVHRWVKETAGQLLMTRKPSIR